MFTAPVDLNPRHPSFSSAMPTNSLESAPVILIAPGICVIPRLRSETKITPFVVRWLRVSMVNVAIGPASGHIQPRKPTRSVIDTINRNITIIILVNAASYRPNWTMRTAHQPNPDTALRIIFQKTPESFGCQYFLFISAREPLHRNPISEFGGASPAGR